MRKKLLIIGFMVLIIIVLGGWFFMKMAERPTALKDSLTASHLDKESRTSDGFFRYTSKKNEYSMLFPEEFAIEGGTFQEKKGFESWNMSPKSNDKEALQRSIKILYTSSDSITDAFFERYSFEGKYETINKKGLNGKEVYIGYVNNYFDKDAKLIKRDPAKYGPSLVVSLIRNPSTGETIKVHSLTVCPENSSCEKVSLQSEKKFILRIAKSIKF
ncbi:hypothetical protein [Rossellomorea sp. RS05]|uniref:hypothetical protein n=1 Tax=Rossellomorea sp. RS05 TaxID=3149166 RepID=UPI0032220898